MTKLSQKDPLVSHVWHLAEPICQAHGLELVEVRLLSDRGGACVRVMIDRVRRDGDVEVERESAGSGVSLDDCTAVSRDMSTALDLHEDMMPKKYRLEISSPGLDRPLVKLSDFERFSGQQVSVRTERPLDSRRRFRGRLEGVREGLVELTVDGSAYAIPYEMIERANLVHEF